MTTEIEILTKIRDIMHASGLFATLTGYSIGIFPYIPIADRYSICQLVILSSTHARRETTNVDGLYVGQAIFEVMGQDIFELTGTPPSVTATTYNDTVSRCGAFLKVFNDEDNHDLANLVLANGGMVEFIDLDQNVEYLAAIEREDTYVNRGIITFAVRTKEPAV